MTLEMRKACERCGAPLAPDAAALICVYECTFCTGYADALRYVCPNRGGELAGRPRSKPAHVSAQAAA